MRIKQFLFLVILGLLAVGIGILGFIWGPWLYKNFPVAEPVKVVSDSNDETYYSDSKVDTISTVFVSPEMIDAFFKNAIPVSAPPNDNEAIKSLLVPHHLIAGNYLAGIFASVRNLQPATVVVIGSNHYPTDAAADLVLSTDLSWETTAGVLPADIQIIRALSASNLISLNNDVFTNEHSIGALVPFIRHTWPQTKIVPLIVRNNRNDEWLAGLAAKLYEILPRGSLVIASVDFSHYLPSAVANFHDDLSLNVLTTGDSNRIAKMEIDSQNSIRILFRYNALMGARKFSLVFHTNSANIAKPIDLTETTSHVFGYFTSGAPSASSSVVVQMFGDMMLERSVEQNFGTEKLDYVFKNLRGQENRFFYGMDLLVANLEGPFAEKRVPTNKSIAFRFDPNLASQLKKYSFSGFSLANNHTLDMGVKNDDFTRQVLTANGLAYFGHQTKEGEEYIWVAGEKEAGISEKVAFIGINNTDHIIDRDKIKSSIQVARARASYVIAVMHWGNEYQRISNADQRALGHWLIEQGVTAVIGMHPHVVQEMEIYQGCPIFYSLGNFVFDQYFSRETQEGLSVGLNLQAGKIKDVYIFPFYSVKSQNALMNDQRRNDFLRWFTQNSRLGDYKFIENKLSL